MAHAALVVALGYVGAVISIDIWPPNWIPNTCAARETIAMLGAMIGWLIIHVYMRWQLRNRRVAALYVASLLKVLRHWSQTPPTEDDLKPHNESNSPSSTGSNWLDFFITTKSARISTDEGLEGYPKAMVKEYLETKTGALFAETLVTWGSIFLGLILLVRVWP